MSIKLAGSAADDSVATRTSAKVGRGRTLAIGGRGGLEDWSHALEIAVEVLAILVFWEVLGLTVGRSTHILPTPVTVGNVIWTDRSVMWGALRFTVGEAFWGFLVGNAAAVALGALSLLNRRLAAVVLQLGVVSYCLPIVAIGPILIILLNGSLPDEILAGIAVVFTTLVLTVEGLQSATIKQTEVILAFGGSTLQLLWKVRVRVSLPYVFRGLQIAAPASILGAIIGEFLSGTSGLGVVMMQAAQSLQVSQTWAAGALATVVAGAAYAMIATLGRIVCPWARDLALS